MYYQHRIPGFLPGLLHAGCYEVIAKPKKPILRDRLNEVMKLTKIKLHLAVLFTLVAFSAFGQSDSKVFLFVGSFTSGEATEGIIVYDFNTDDGKLTEVEREDDLINPSFIAISPNGKYLYACTETRLDRHGSVSSFKIDSLTGKINFLNKQSAGGRNPVHVTVGKDNKFVVVSNYTDPGVSVFECKDDGSLRPLSALIEFHEGSNIIEGRQDKAHIHSSNFSPDNAYIFSPDLGADKIRATKFDPDNLLTTVDSLTVSTKKGSGPRHFTFHPNKPFAYCAEELSGSVSAYAYQAGRLRLLDTYASYKRKRKKYKSADIHVSPDGKFLYASNRETENSISIFRIDAGNGKLKLVGHKKTYGKIPRSFVIDPTGNFLIVANKASDNLVVYRRDLRTGLLTKTGRITGLKSPSSLKMIKYGG